MLVYQRVNLKSSNPRHKQRLQALKRMVKDVLGPCQFQSA